MQFKRRGTRVQLYRSRWVSKGTHGNSHGYPDPLYLGSLPKDAQSVPCELIERLEASEVRELETKLVEPARRAAMEQRQRAEARDRDPRWRMEQCVRLLREAGELCGQQPVDQQVLGSLTAAVSKLVTQGGLASTVSSAADPLREALRALQQAASAVRGGDYGPAPGVGVRTTTTYRTWGEICESVMGEAEHSLQSALQEQGWVKRRGRQSGG